MPFRIRRGTFGAALFLLAVSGTLGGAGWYARSTGAGPAGADPSRDKAYAVMQGHIWVDLSQFASFADVQVVHSGLEVDLVGQPTDAIRAVVARDNPRYHGKPVPISYRVVRHTYQQLQVMSDRVRADLAYWGLRGIDLVSLGFDVKTNTVQVSLSHYSDAYRDAMLARYGGSDWVSVVPHDVPRTPSAQ